MSDYVANQGENVEVRWKRDGRSSTVVYKNAIVEPFGLMMRIYETDTRYSTYYPVSEIEFIITRPQ